MDEGLQFKRRLDVRLPLNYPMNVNSTCQFYDDMVKKSTYI